MESIADRSSKRYQVYEEKLAYYVYARISIY